jgi:Uma2 family endonuclease
MSGLREKLKSSLPPKGKISFEEFLDWMDEDIHAEWVDGEVVMTSPANIKHQDVSLVLALALRIYSDIFDLGKVLQAPIQMKLTKNSREPDIIFIAKPNLAKLQPTFLQGAADLVVEIVSPESQTRDREDKYKEYEADKVKEYWLIDPTKLEAIFYQLDSNGKFQTIPLDADGNYHSKVLPGFWLNPAWFWRPNIPSVNSILLKINKEAYQAYLSQIDEL